jgi:uncharacterized protein (DUF983 family)
MNDVLPEAENGPSVLSASLKGRCPRCGKGSLFRDYLSVRPSCTSCNLDFSAFEAGDGPAVFVILIVGAIVAGGALILEVSAQPPYWVHAVIWGPALLILSLGLLRPLKAALIVLQYKHKAEEGRLGRG